MIFSFGGDSILKRDNLRQLKAARALRADIPLVIVSDQAEPDEVAAALNFGAQGFLHTEISRELAIQAFSFILSGGSYFPPSAMRQLQNRSDVARDPGHGLATPNQEVNGEVNRHPGNASRLLDEEGRGSSLTARQKAVLEHLCHGEPNKLIARRLGMTEGTVKVHVRQIMRKLGAANRTQVAVCAMGPDPVWQTHSGIGSSSSTGRGLARNGSEGASSNT